MPVLTFKVTPEQARQIRRAARLRQLTLSDYLRQTAIPEPTPAAPAQIDLTPGHVVIPTPRLNKEIIDAALYD